MGGPWRDRLGCTIDAEKETAARLDGLVVRPPASPKRSERSLSPCASEAKAGPQALPPERQIPGYSGHVPGIGPQNVYGKTFRGATEKAATNRYAVQEERNDDMLSLNRDQSPIPGYTGHVHGLVPENVHGTRYHLATAQASQARSGREARNEDLFSPKAASTSSEFRPRSLSRCRDAPPGYTGHIPGRDACNVYGKGFGSANRAASPNDGERSVNQAWSDSLREGSRSPSRSPRSPIPGYSGYVPKKGPRNFYGASFRRANDEANLEGNLEEDRQSARSASSRGSRSPRSPIASPRSPAAGYVPKGNHYARPDKTAPPIPSSTSKRRDRGMPHYGGYIPRVDANNHFGRRHTYIADKVSETLTRERDQQCDETSSMAPSESNRSIRSNMSTGRAHIPGYTGYIPRKGPDNIIGASFAKVNERAALGVDPVGGAETEIMRHLG